MIQLSVIVLTLNEADNIAACLGSARGFADELIVFDSLSQDGTTEIAEASGATVYQRTFDSYPAQRNAALEISKGEWVFFLDADERANERVGAELRTAVDETESSSGKPVLYWIPRRNYIFGKLVKHAGWSPDYQPRLMLKSKVKFDPARLVHETVIANGVEGYLREPLVHCNYNSLDQFRAKQREYTRAEAKTLYLQGIHPRMRSMIGQPLREFFRRFVTLEGYRDGALGLWLSILMGYYAYSRQQTLARLWRQ